MKLQELFPIAIWSPDSNLPAFSAKDLISIVPHIREPVHIVRAGSRGPLGVAISGRISPLHQNINDLTYLLMGTLPALYPEWLGGARWR